MYEIEFGSMKKGTTRLRIPPKNSFTGSQKNHEPIVMEEVKEAPLVIKEETKTVSTDLDFIRESTPDDLMDEMDLGGSTLHKLGDKSFALRDKKSGISSFFIYNEGEWVNRFNSKQKL